MAKFCGQHILVKFYIYYKLGYNESTDIATILSPVEVKNSEIYIFHIVVLIW